MRDVLSRPLEGFATDLAAAIRAARRLLKSRALVVVISDFRAEGWQAEIGALARRHDVVAIALSDRAENAFPSRGLFRLRDAETGAHKTTTTDWLRGDVRHVVLAPRAAVCQGGRGLSRAPDASFAVPRARAVLSRARRLRR